MKLRTIASRARGFARRVLRPGARMESAFAPFYADNLWGEAESVSGPGSTLARTAKLRGELPALLAEVGARTLLDAPCGDFNWMKETVLGVEEYVGADIVPALVARNRRLYGDGRRRFVVLDVTRDRLPRADVILCRDCFIHFSYRHVAAAVNNFKRSRSAYLLTNTYPLWPENQDIETGGFRPVNLALPPFDFPPPLRLLREKHGDEEAEFYGKSLALWKLSDL